MRLLLLLMETGEIVATSFGKSDSDISLASQESVFLIAKATELFVASLAFIENRVNRRERLCRNDRN